MTKPSDEMDGEGRAAGAEGQDFVPDGMTRSTFLRGTVGAGAALAAGGGLLAACGDDDESSSTAEGGSIKGRSLKLLAWEDTHWTALKAVAGDWAKREQVKLTFDIAPFAGLYQKIVLASQSQRSEYDLYGTDAIWNGGFIASGWFANLDEVADTKLDMGGYIPGLVDTYGRGPDGALHAVPIQFTFMLGMYNKPAYKKAGIAEIGSTWEEIQGHLPILAKGDADVAPIVCMVNDTDGTMWDWSVHLTGRDLPENSDMFLWTNDYEPAFEGEIGLQSVEDWLAYKPFSQPGVNSSDYTTALNTFMRGKGATWVCWVPFASALEGEDSGVAGKIGYALPPTDPSASDPKYWGDSFTVGMNEFSKNKDVAHRFLEYMTTPEAQEAMRRQGGVATPYLADALSDSKWEDGRPYWPVVQQIADKLAPCNTAVRQFPQLEKLTVDTLQRGWVGGESADATVEALVSNYRDFFSENGYT